MTNGAQTRSASSPLRLLAGSLLCVVMTIIAVMVIFVAIVAMVTTDDIYDSVDGKGPIFCALFPHMATVLLPHGKNSKSDPCIFYLILCTRGLDIRSICWFWIGGGGGQ